MNRHSDMSLDEQVWELIKEHRTPREIAEILGISRSRATEAVVRLKRARGNPGIAAIGESIAQLRAIRF